MAKPLSIARMVALYVAMKSPKLTDAIEKPVERSFIRSASMFARYRKPQGSVTVDPELFAYVEEMESKYKPKPSLDPPTQNSASTAGTGFEYSDAENGDTPEA